MTGKEALAIFKGWELSNPFEKEEVDLNSVRYVDSQLNKEYHDIIKAIEKDLERLEKLEKVVKLLKGKIEFEDFGEMKSGNVWIAEFIDCVNEEEYELLEELMKGG